MTKLRVIIRALLLVLMVTSIPMVSGATTPPKILDYPTEEKHKDIPYWLYVESRLLNWAALVIGDNFISQTSGNTHQADIDSIVF